MALSSSYVSGTLYFGVLFLFVGFFFGLLFVIQKFKTNNTFVGYILYYYIITLYTPINSLRFGFHILENFSIIPVFILFAFAECVLPLVSFVLFFSYCGVFLPDLTVP